MNFQLRDQIDSCAALFLRRIEEPRELSLRLLVQEADAGREAPPLVIGGVDLAAGARVVESAAHHRVFEIVWDSYIAYCVTNESYGKPDGVDERREAGRWLRSYSESHFLEHVARQTIATPEYPGPLQHFCVVCQFHVVDVVSTQSPEIRKLAGREQRVEL